MAKTKVATKSYVLPTGETSQRFHPEAVGFTFVFGDGSTLGAKYEEFPDVSRKYAMGNGFMQLLGDRYAGAENASDAFEAAEIMLERLKNGEIAAPREGLGPSPVLILEAIKAAKAEAGLPHDEAAAKEKYKDKEAREKALSNAKVKAHYERLRAERAAAKAAEAAKKAAESTGEAASVADL